MLWLCALLLVRGWAEQPVEVTRVSGRASERLLEAERRWRVARQQTWRAAAAKEEREVAAAIAETWAGTFRAGLGEVRVATRTGSSGDVLLARWTLNAGAGIVAEAVAWDTPEDTTFLLRLPAGSWSGEDAVRRTFSALLLPGVAAKVNLAQEAGTRRWIGAGGLPRRYIPRQFGSGLMNWFDFWEGSGAAYLSLGFHWTAAARYPPDMRSIPERFPPLVARAAQWRKQALLAELACGQGFRTDDRDRILMRELLRRDLTDDELFELLQARGHDASGTVLWVVVRERQVQRFERALRRYLGSTGGGAGKGNHPFGILTGSDEADFTAEALEALRRNARNDAAFRYVTRRGTTAAQYRALAELPPVERAYGRDFDLAEMRRRLGLREDGTQP